MNSTNVSTIASAPPRFKAGDLVKTNEDDFVKRGYLIWPEIHGKIGTVLSVFRSGGIGCNVNWGFETSLNTTWHQDNLVLAEEGVVDKILTKYSNA